MCSIGWFLTEVQGFAKRLSSKRIVCIELVFGTIVFVLVATYHLNSFSSSRFNPLSTNNNLILHSASGTANSASSEMQSLYDADKRVGLDEQRNKQKNINYERGGSDLSFISIVEQNTKKELVIQFYETVLLSIFEGNKGTKLNSEEQQSVIKHSEMLTKLGKEQRWDEFELYLKQIDDLTQQVIDEMALTIATITAAPIEFIESIMNRGIEIPIESVLLLLENEDVAYLQELENLGLNFNIFTDKNMNPVDVASIVRTSLPMFDYLLSKSHDLSQKNDFGLDSLGVAITNAPANLYQNNQYISKLLNAGSSK